MGAKPSITNPKDIKHTDSLRELEIRIKTAEAQAAEEKAQVAKENAIVAKENTKVAKENTKVAKVKTGLLYLFVAIPPFLALITFFGELDKDENF
jgi:hypothetical protein